MVKPKKVLIIDGKEISQGAVQIFLDLAKDGAEVVAVKTIEEARPFFNGEAKAGLLIISHVSGMRDFVREVRRRFKSVYIIGLAEYRQELADLGCHCFATRNALQDTVTTRLRS